MEEDDGTGILPNLTTSCYCEGISATIWKTCSLPEWRQSARLHSQELGGQRQKECARLLLKVTDTEMVAGS